MTILRKEICRLGARRGEGRGGTVGKPGQRIERALSGQRYVVSKLGRLKTRWKGYRSRRVMWGRFADDDRSSWGQEGCRTWWNGWKTLSAHREGA